MADIECDICFRSFNGNNRKPRNLPCGHVCCSYCLGQSISRGCLDCSTCRSPHNASTVSDLPVNFYIMKLVEEPPITDKPKESTDDFHGGYCPEHKSSYLYFVCRTHNIQICRECTVLMHSPSTCDIISFKDQIEQKRSNMLNEVDSKISLLTESIIHLNNYERSKENDIKYKGDEIKRLLEEVDEDKKASDEAKKAKEESTNIQKSLKSMKGKLEDATKNDEITEACSIVKDNVRSSVIWIQDIMKNFDYKLSESLFIKNPECFLRMFANGSEKVYVQKSGSVHRSAELAMKDGMIVLNALHKNVKPTEHAVTIPVSHFLDLDNDEDNSGVEDYRRHCHRSTARRDNFNRSGNLNTSSDEEELTIPFDQWSNAATNRRTHSAAFLRQPRAKISKVFITFGELSSKQILGTVYISIDQQAPQAKQFISLFTGTQGYSYKGVTQVQVMKDNKNVSFAISNNNCVQENGNHCQKSLFSQHSNNSNNNEKNNVCLYGRCGFIIFNENPPANQDQRCSVVGSVVSGLEVINKVADMISGKTGNVPPYHPFTYSYKYNMAQANKQVTVIIDEVGIVIQ